MGNNYWMKLWFDILRDPKMGMLPDRLWRRVIELFLLAGQNGEDGVLPDIQTIAWQLNRSVSSIKTDLENIEKTGIVHYSESGDWIVTNFKKRNEPVNPAKRTKDFRRRERYEKGNENVTEVKRECNDALQLRYQEEQKNRRTDKQIKNSINSSLSFAEKGDESDEIWLTFSSAFEELTGIEPKPTDAVVAMLAKFDELGVTVDEYRRAIQEMQAGNYTVATMKSPETWVMNNRNSKKPTSTGHVRAIDDKSIWGYIPGYVGDTSNEEVIINDD